MVDNSDINLNHSRTRIGKIVEEFVSCLFRGEKVMPILHYAPFSPPCRSVLLLGRILNIEFDLRVVDVLKGDNMKPEFIEINPQHTIPTLEDHGLVLWESRVILSYLVAAYSKDDILYPRDIRMRAIVDQRLQFDLSTLAARTGDYFFSALFTGVLDDSKKTKLIEALGFFEMMLKGRTWAAVNNFTIADLALTITVAQLMSLRFDLEPYTRIRTWLERCKEFLRPHGYDEIQKGSDDLADLFREKLNL